MDDFSQHALQTLEPCLPEELRKPRLRRREASRYLLAAHGLSFAVSTLEKLASIGGGPGFQRCNRTPLYSVSELDKWALQKLGGVVYSTSEVSGG